MAAEPPTAPCARPPARMRSTNARMPNDVLAAATHVMAHAMRRRRAMNRWVMFVWTRACVGWSEGDHAGEQETRRHKFLLHHHSFCWEAPRPVLNGRPIGGPIGRENDFRSERERRDFVAACVQHAAQIGANLALLMKPRLACSTVVVNLRAGWGTLYDSVAISGSVACRRCRDRAACRALGRTLVASKKGRCDAHFHALGN